MKGQVVDTFAVTFLMEDFLLNLQIPKTPRVIVAALHTDRKYVTHGKKYFCVKLRVKLSK